MENSDVASAQIAALEWLELAQLVAALPSKIPILVLRFCVSSSRHHSLS
jgi:hypothetical protein